MRSTAECEAFVQALPGSGTAPLLRTRVDDTNRKYEHLAQLLDSAQEKWVAGRPEEGRGGVKEPPPLMICVLRIDVANRLEKSLQQGRELLASHENRLTQDDTVPDNSSLLDGKRQELEVNMRLKSWNCSLSWVRQLVPPPTHTHTHTLRHMRAPRKPLGASPCRFRGLHLPG